MLGNAYTTLTRHAYRGEDDMRMRRVKAAGCFRDARRPIMPAWPWPTNANWRSEFCQFNADVYIMPTVQTVKIKIDQNQQKQVSRDAGPHKLLHD